MSRCGMDVLKRFDGADTLHYCDPPYLPQTRAKGGAGYVHELTEADHESLAALLHSLKGKVMLSGYHSELYDRLYSEWRVVQRVQALTCSRSKGGVRTEVLWMNF